MQPVNKTFFDARADDGTPTAERHPAARRFLAPDRCDWVVTQLPAPSPNRGTAQGRGECLIFSSSVAWRRVREFPADWRERSDEDLWEISWHR